MSADHLSYGSNLRLRRLHRHDDSGVLIVPMDHSVTDGPITPAAGLSALVRQLGRGGVDAVVLHRGTVRSVEPVAFNDTSLVVHLSASTVHAPDPDAKYLVASVETALRLGADAVSVHVNLGSQDEPQQIADLAMVAEACDRWSMPLMAMMYPRGPRVANPRDPALIAHAASLAADLGADIVKTPYPGTVQELADVTRSCPIPLVVAGGPQNPDPEAVLSYVDDAMKGGAAGVAMGRNIFQAPDPGAMASRVSKRIHGMVVATEPPLAVAVPGNGGTSLGRHQTVTA